MSRRVVEGYAMVAGSFLIIGLTGTLVTWATAPESALLTVRFACACVILAIVFARRRPLAGVRGRDVWPRLLLVGALDACTVLLYFYAVRATGVAAATFFTFVQPVWVALLAPRFLKTPTDRVVPVALAVALGGLGVILAPSLVGENAGLSAAGVLAGLVAGVTYAAFQILVKGLTRQVSPVTIVLAQTTLDTLILLPIALWQTVGSGYQFTSRDLFVALVLGVLCTAVAYMMWTEGMSRLRVQHSSILGFLTPVVAPIYAFVFLGQGITAWTVAGGALIVAAGVLVVLYGREDSEPEPFV
jgi:drug/metabolite transporter, DME family